MTHRFLVALTLLALPATAQAQAWGGGIRPTDEIPGGAWIRQDDTNAMSDKVTTTFTVPSRETFELAPPYSVRTQRAYLSVISVEGADKVEVSLEDGYINCIGTLTVIRFRFGTDRPITAQCELPAGGLSNRARINGVGPIISQMRRNKPVTVEFQTIGSPSPVVVTFPNEEFHWPRRGRLF